MNYNCLPDSIEILDWPGFHNHYKNITRFPASLKKIKMMGKADIVIHNKIENEIQNYFKNALLTIEIMPRFWNRSLVPTHPF